MIQVHTDGEMLQGETSAMKIRWSHRNVNKPNRLCRIRWHSIGGNFWKFGTAQKPPQPKLVQKPPASYRLINQVLEEPGERRGFNRQSPATTFDLYRVSVEDIFAL